MRNRWTRSRIDYHPCITSEPTNHEHVIAGWVITFWRHCKIVCKSCGTASYLIILSDLRTKDKGTV